MNWHIILEAVKKCKRKNQIFNMQYPLKITVIISFFFLKEMTRNLDETFFSANDQ